MDSSCFFYTKLRFNMKTVCSRCSIRWKIFKKLFGSLLTYPYLCIVILKRVARKGALSCA